MHTGTALSRNDHACQCQSLIISSYTSLFEPLASLTITTHQRYNYRLFSPASPITSLHNAISRSRCLLLDSSRDCFAPYPLLPALFRTRPPTPRGASSTSSPLHPSADRWPLSPPIPRGSSSGNCSRRNPVPTLIYWPISVTPTNPLS